MESLLSLVWLIISHWRLICLSFACLWAVTGTAQLIDIRVTVDEG